MGRTRSRSSLAGLILFIAALIGLAVWYTHTDDAEDTTEHVAVKGPQRVAVSASWVDSSWTGYVAIGLLETDLKDVAFGLSDFSGNQYPYAPKWSASVGGSYDTGNGIFAAFDVSAQGDAEGTFDNRPGTSADARVLVNAGAGWRWGNLSVSLYGRNLLDDEYFLFSDLDYPSGQNQVFYPGDPRELGLTLDLEW